MCTVHRRIEVGITVRQCREKTIGTAIARDAGSDRSKTSRNNSARQWTRVRTRAIISGSFLDQLLPWCRGRIAVDRSSLRDESLDVMARPESGDRCAWSLYPGVARDYRFPSQRDGGASETISRSGRSSGARNLERLIETLPGAQGTRCSDLGWKPHTQYQDECEALVLDRFARAQRGGISRTRIARGSLELRAQAGVIAMNRRATEGFGYAAAQGMCAGIPVSWSFGSGIVAGVLGDGARVVPVDDTQAWRIVALRAVLRGRR